MTLEESRKWLLLIHQLPPTPNALRVKIWRRLQQIGAVAVKQSVYAMPNTEQAREDLSWILKEIVEGGGDGSISEVRFLEGLSDRQLIALFENARKADYEKIIQETRDLSEALSSAKSMIIEPVVSAPTTIARLRKRFDEIGSIDFFQCAERGVAEMLLKDLTAKASGRTSSEPTPHDGFGALKGKVWVTRKNVFVDRIACGWLIRRFVDPNAIFHFVDGSIHVPGERELRFDMYDGEFTHEGNRCSFEVMIRRFGVQDHALNSLAEIVHDIDLKETRYNRIEADGVNALLVGLTVSQPDDDKRMRQGFELFENLYAYFLKQK